MYKANIFICAILLFIVRASSAADSTIFQPIIAGVNQPQSFDLPPTNDQWTSWCGLRIKSQQSKKINKKAETKSYYTMIDRQRICGKFDFSGPTISWSNSVFQSIPIDLETAQIIGTSLIQPIDNSSTDTIILVNNDRLEGFIESIDGNNGITIETTTPSKNLNEKASKQILRIPIQRSAEIRLVQKTKKATGWRFWLEDGSVFDADSWSNQHNMCFIQNQHVVVAMESVSIPWHTILAMAPNQDAITALSQCVWKVIPDTSKNNERLGPPNISTTLVPTAFDAMPMDLHGPGTFHFSTQTQNATLSASVSIPSQLKNDIGCRVCIENDGKIVWQQVITPEFSGTTICIPLIGTEFTVRLDESKRGAFGCGIRLTDAILISQSCSATPRTSHPPATVPAKSDL